jgi:hypothetical protein
MSGLVWLASYPKSGNTWFRLLVANLLADDAPIDINDVPDRGGIASSRGEFEAVTLIESGLLTHEEADSLRPRVYTAVADRSDGDEDEVAAGPRLIKVHDAYVATPLGEPLLGAASAAILIVRDPRDVAPSLANHRRFSIDEAIDFMNKPVAAFAAGRWGQPPQMRQRLLDWSGHAASWLDQTDLPVRVVRYEDLDAAPVETFRAAMQFAGRSVSRSDAERAVEFAGFGRLQEQERERGFAEWRERRDGRRFFRRGESGGWRRELTADQVRRIEAAHGPMMARFGYRPAAQDCGATAPVSAGEVR